jgi:hypothetical protein
MKIVRLHSFLAFVIGLAVAWLGTAGSAQAQTANSLWIGTDNTSDRLVLNTDRTGALLQSVGPVEATGFAIDLKTNTIYFGTSNGTTTPRNLTTLATGASFSASGTEDMTFGGNFIWRAGTTGPAASPIITKTDPATHASGDAFTVPFQALGIAWDGSGLWVGESAINGLIQRFDPSGNPTGQSFHTSGNFVNGGLAYDNTDGTLYIGTFGKVYHYTTTGTQLGFFNIPATDGRFVDGLELEPSPVTAVPALPRNGLWILALTLAAVGFALMRRAVSETSGPECCRRSRRSPS